eukprot:5749417-Amphidinium_carterae.1
MLQGACLSSKANQPKSYAEMDLKNQAKIYCQGTCLSFRFHYMMHRTETMKHIPLLKEVGTGVSTLVISAKTKRHPLFCDRLPPAEGRLHRRTCL